MLLTVLHTMLLRFHVDGDFFLKMEEGKTSVCVDMALKMIPSVVVCTALQF